MSECDISSVTDLKRVVMMAFMKSANLLVQSIYALETLTTC